MAGTHGAMTWCSLPYSHSSRSLIQKPPSMQTCQITGDVNLPPPATIPPTFIGTTTWPDLFVVDGKRATMLELTVPWNNLASIKNVRARKQGKTNYQLLASDLSAHGYQVQLLTIEIGCLGHYTHEAYTALRLATPQSKASDRPKALTNAAKAAISGSYTIFSAHKSPWNLGAS